MPQITTAEGQIIDLDTGEVVGQTQAPVAQGKMEIPTSAMDVARQGSYAFNAALFALPDAAVRQIGKALGLPDNEVRTLTKLFNKDIPRFFGEQGERAPKNAAERYARAIGTAVGANVPITGVLGYMASSQKLAAPLLSDATVLKRVAKDTLDFIRRNPKAALAADIGSGVAFGAAEQFAKEEELGPVAETVLPLAASIAGPAGVSAAGAAASKLPLPSVMAAKYGRELIDPSRRKLTEVGREITGEYPFLMRPMVSPLVQRAEKKAGQALGQGEVQISLQEAEQLIQDLGAQGIRLNTAERTMLPYFVKEQGAAVRSMSGEQLRQELARRTENMNQFGVIMERLAPKTGMSAEDALNQIRLDAEDLQGRIIQQIADEKGIEAARLLDRFTPANRDVLGNEIREAILAGGEHAFWNLRNVENKLGLRMQYTQDGVPLPTRDSNGVSQFPSVDIEKPLNNILEKYRIFTGPVKERVPYLVNLLGRYKGAQGQKGTNAYEDSLTKELTNILVKRERPGAGGAVPDFLDPREAAASAAGADLAFRNQQEAIASSLAKELISPASLTGTAKRPGLADIKLPEDRKFELIAKSYGLDPKEVKDAVVRAKDQAAKTGKIDINFPEAVELLQKTTEYRNNMVRNFMDSQMQGGKTRLAAQKELDKANALHKDISDMLFDAVPQLGAEYKNFRQAYADIYEGAYERYLPLLLGAKRPTGEFLTANEAVLKEAFKSAENMRDMKILLGGTPKGDELITKATMDWLAGKNILDKDGIIDPKKLDSVLKSNKNIVEALPDPLKTALNDELTTGKAFASRMAQLETRKESVIDAELNKLLTQISREGAEPGPILERALRNPADMKSLVNSVQSKPELLEALRRGVYNMAGEQFGEKSIATFLDNANKRSLSFLFTPEQLTNLRKLGELEKRIRVSEGITDTPKPFETTDEALQRIAGVSVRNITTMYRGMTGAGGYKASPMDAGVYLMMRLMGRQEYGIMDRVMQRAITDPDFAAALVNNAQQESMQKQLAKLQKKLHREGVYIPEVVYKAPQRAAVIEGVEAIQEPVPSPVPELAAPQPVPQAPAPAQPSAQQMMQEFKKQQPPAPPTRGVPKPQELKPAFPTQAPKASGGGNAAQMYQALFPNDTLGNMLIQRQQ